MKSQLLRTALQFLPLSMVLRHSAAATELVCSKVADDETSRRLMWFLIESDFSPNELMRTLGITPAEFAARHAELMDRISAWLTGLGIDFSGDAARLQSMQQKVPLFGIQVQHMQ